jgi:fumarate hydratase class I
VRVDDQIESFADDVASAGSRAPASPPGVHTMKEFQEILPLGKDETPYRLLTREHVSTAVLGDQRFLKVASEGLSMLTREAMRDIAHTSVGQATSRSSARSWTTRGFGQRPLRRARSAANANIAAGGVLPMCQDTGTAIVMGKKGQIRADAGGRRGGARARHL